MLRRMRLHSSSPTHISGYTWWHSRLTGRIDRNRGFESPYHPSYQVIWRGMGCREPDQKQTSGVATTSMIVIAIAPICTHAVLWCLQVLKVLEIGLGTIITCTPDPRVSDNGNWDVGNAKFLTVPITGQSLASNIYWLPLVQYTRGVVPKYRKGLVHC